MANVPDRVIELVETFERNIEVYRSQQYNEAQLRREFIDPLFEELGWDITNKQGFAPQYREVVHEDAIKIAGETKAPDYGFCIGGVRKFFLEAKKPFVNINADADPAYQLRRYAWSAKLPLSILTNFETFTVYDCQIRPKHTDRPSTARIMNLTYKQYLDNWNEIADVFSKDAVLKGSFDKYAVSTKGKRGTTTVDTEFLAEIENWRQMLAKIVALRNRELSIRDINFAVQQTIDRILFLRLCEDRGIEPYGQLRAISSGDRNYLRLCEVFEKADQKYNSGLFHFSVEPGRPEPPDELTLKLTIDDKDLKWILFNLYYPQSPYEFSVLPAEILGNVYEQFLGKVVRLTTGHRAVVEEKPEVKKAGGVYYTPSYIVDYIVKNTVGNLLGDLSICHSRESGNPPAGQRLTPKQVSNIKILDPACGSGSFLLGAYTYLLNYHLDWYINNDPENWLKKKNPPIYQVVSAIRHSDESAAAGDKAISNYRLTVTEKKRILLNNIFGVDIDSQAVEVTKLSLLLKVLEGENSQSLENQHRFFHERALPDLAANIKCGNSLIGTDFYNSFDSSCHSRAGGNPEELRDRINAFDWQAEFPEIFTRKNPGFDIIIGNPPYRSLLLGKKQKSEDSSIIEYLSKKLPNSSQYKINLFGLFMEKCIGLISANRLFSFIIPNLFFTSHYFKALRHYFLKEGTFLELLDLRYKVFEKAEIGGNGIFVFSPSWTLRKTRISVVNSQEQFDNPKVFYESPASFTNDPGANLMIDSSVRSLSKKIGEISSVSLGSICTIYQGIITGNNGDYLSKSCKGKKWREILRGRDIERYSLQFGKTYVLYEPKYLWSNTDEKMFKVKEKIISRQTSDHLVATLDIKGYFSLDSTHVIHLKKKIFSIKYLLGIFNSRLINFLYQTQVRESGRVFAQVKVVNLKPLPIRIIDFDNPDDVAKHNKMVKLVERMLDLHNQLAATKIPDEKTKIQRQIDAADKQIDALVYNLYGLSEEEIKIVEGTN